MSTDTTPDATLRKTWAELGIEPEELSLSDTIASVDTIESLSAPARGALDPLLEPTTDGGIAPILLGDPIGEGGMGVVRSATQTALQRTVAVKALRVDVPRAEQALQLLREGRVTGLLEHPNVVPVHMLGRDQEGKPLIVMKRIDGEPWSSMIEGVPPTERHDPAFIRKHLSILRQVASALHFAHSLGILHRDIKPENVMIGGFGEVYLVDWGVAVSLSEVGPLGVPRARDVKRIEGTPLYMSPEMALGKGEGLGVFSDVYLLGATLHELITGKPPHEAAHVSAALMKAFVSQTPTYDEHVPRELAAIARQAMAREPEKRFESAEAFAEAIDDFLLHWGSVELCEEAERRTEELRRASQIDGERSEADQETIEALFHEGRFAFDQALRSWPENERAIRGRRTLLEAMIEFQLERGSPRVAKTLLRQHDAPPEVLRGAVEQAARALDRVERDADLGFGLRERVVRLYVSAAGFAAFCLGTSALTRFDIWPVDHVRFALLGTTFLVGAGLSGMVWWRKMLLNATNRRVTLTSLLVFAQSMVLWPLLGALGVSMPHATVIGAFVNGTLWATLLGTLGWPWLPLTLGHYIVALVAWALPAYHLEVFACLAIPVVITGHWMARANRGT